MSLQSRLDHHWSRHRIHDYVDDDLSARQRTRLERHAQTCPECGPMLRGMLRLITALRTLRGRARHPIAPAVIARLRSDDHALRHP